MNDCCCIDIDDLVTLLSDNVVKARKDHCCCECGETIGRGHLHSVEVTIFDGRIRQYRTCARCRNVRDEYFSCGWSWGNVVNDFMDCYGFDYRRGIPADFAPCKGRATT